MKTRLSLFCALLMTAAHSFGQVKATRTPGTFTGIKAGDAFDIKVVQGEPDAISIETESQETMDHIQTDVRNNILVIGSGGKLKHMDKIHLTVTAKNLDYIELSGATDLSSDTPFKTDKITFNCNGASDLHMNVDAGRVIAKLSGAGDIVLTGKTGFLSAEISGAGTLKAMKLETDTANVKVSGAGDARINPKNKLVAQVSGAGDVVYQDEPKEKVVEISGAGSVRQSHAGKVSASKGPNDTTKISLGHKKLCIINDEEEEKDCDGEDHDRFKHWRGVDLGVNGLLTNDNMTTMPKGSEFMELDYSKSIVVGLNIFEKDIHLAGNHLNLVTGLGMEFDHFALKNNVSLLKQPQYTSATNDTVSYSKNKLNENFVTVPLMLEWNAGSNSRRSFHVAFGMLGEYRLWSKTKQDFTNNQGKDVYITKSDDYNLSAFRASFIGRIGYGKLTLFGTYGLTQLFTSGRGPQLYPFTVGINIPI